MKEKTVFELSVRGRHGVSLSKNDVPCKTSEELIGKENLRDSLPLPEMSEMDTVRHFTALTRKNYSIDNGFYPLGSCTMKYNPKMNETIAHMPGFANLHPLQPEETLQGALEVIYNLEGILTEIAGMHACTVQPAAGAHGELLGLMMIHAYHKSRGDAKREWILIPDSAHGTNPASAARCGFKVKSVPTNSQGLTDVQALKGMMNDTVAAFMLTNPNTTGLFEKNIREICKFVHTSGGLVYCDGANMNALLGIARPGDMGFDVMHFNMHKTFSTPHGGGGPGCGAVAVVSALEPFLPVPRVEKSEDEYRLNYYRPQSIGSIHSFYGAFLVAVRAYAYIKSLGAEGLRQVAEMAVLNANYIRSRVRGAYDIPHDRFCMHEVVLSASSLKKANGVRALDISKRLMDYGFHPPTNYFPLIIPEALMIEPTETENKETLDSFCEALLRIAMEAKENPELLISAPHHTEIGRLNETVALKQLNVNWLLHHDDKKDG